MRETADLLKIAATLRLDAAAAELTGVLQSRGVRSLVFRGPALRHVLYGDGAYRAYDDIDLLVDAAELEEARRALREHGFRPAVDSDAAQPWVRADGITVDLHTTLTGVRAAATQVWPELSADVQPIRLAGTFIDIPGPSSVALIVALHAAQHGAQAGKALADLERALAQFDRHVWEEAAATAVRLDAVAAFAAGLRLVASGARLATALELPHRPTAEVALRATSAPPTAAGLQRLAETEGMGNKLRLVAREVVPAAPFMRSVYSIARRGRLGLAVAYLWRPFWLLRHVIPAQRARRRAARRLR